MQKTTAYLMPTSFSGVKLQSGLCLLKIRMMNQCIISVKQKTIYTSFLKVVKSGRMKIFNDNNKVICEKDFSDTIFFRMEAKIPSGKYNVVLLLDGQIITKTIAISHKSEAKTS
jgi:hypothetical protein